MKTIIAGSRTINDYGKVDIAIENSLFNITEVVSGGAKGVDLLGERHAEDMGYPIRRFLPDWSKGKSAGLLRNVEMAEYADALIAVWDGKSRGTKHMIDVATKKGLKVYVFTIPDHHDRALEAGVLETPLLPHESLE